MGSVYLGGLGVPRRLWVSGGLYVCLGGSLGSCVSLGGCVCIPGVGVPEM